MVQPLTPKAVGTTARKESSPAPALRHAQTVLVVVMVTRLEWQSAQRALRECTEQQQAQPRFLRVACSTAQPAGTHPKGRLHASPVLQGVLQVLLAPGRAPCVPAAVTALAPGT